MEFTTDQYSHIYDLITKDANNLNQTIRSIKDILQSDYSLFGRYVDDLTRIFNTLEVNYSIQRSIFEQCDFGDREALAREELRYCIKRNKELKEGFEAAVRSAESETNDSDGVLGDKAQD